jgi:Cys-tRNA(Pro)/Cys-tRNA(Cys) deacylase
MLDGSGFPYRLHDHPPVRTIEDARKSVPHLTRNLLKTVAFRIKDAGWVLAAVNGGRRIDYRKLGAAVGVSRRAIRSASPDQVASALGFQIGGVGPFPVIPAASVIFDAALDGKGGVFCGSGRNTRTIEIELPALITLTGARVCLISRE